MEERSADTVNRVGEVQLGNGHNHGRSEDSFSKTVILDVGADKQDLLSNKGQKWVFEKCVNFPAVDSPSPKEMMTVCGGQMELNIRDSHKNNGLMLQEELKEVQDRVKKIKDSWTITGCSILLDAWVDQEGRDLVAFIADSPAGPVYLKSFDVSYIKNDGTALLSLVDGLVEEAGVHNVTQIIVDSTSGWVGELGKLFAARHTRPQVFWSVSVSHCLELLLEKIGKMHSFEGILDKGNNIWEFVNSNPSVLKVFRDHSHGKVISVSSSEFEFVTPYLTLETIFKAKKVLATMFSSSDWNKEEEGIAISNLVNDSSLWKTVKRLLNCTCPLIRCLVLFSTANVQHVGYIYETMDSIKESIARECNHKKLCYEPLWEVIDDVWNEHLHNPLHAAGYFLNPTAFYSTGFHLDPEVAAGLTSSLVLMVQEWEIQVVIAKQLDMYRLGQGCFNEASQGDQISVISPAEWWAEKASQYSELQSFAVKVLSQTCEGASRYKLKRSLAEKLLVSEGMSHSEKQHLEERAFIHYNMHLQSCKVKQSEEK